MGVLFEAWTGDSTWVPTFHSGIRSQVPGTGYPVPEPRRPWHRRRVPEPWRCGGGRPHPRRPRSDT